MKETRQLKSLLVQLYGKKAAPLILERLAAIIQAHRLHLPERQRGLSQRDSFLITYPDQVQQAGTSPLQALADFSRQHFATLLNTIHILPFYPWTSDDGFAVADYRSVASGYGGWEDIENIGRDFQLMFDAVLNHTSTANAWFQGLLAGDPRYQDYFVIPEQGADFSHVVRPRALPLLTSFETAGGVRNVWTTFSADQVDLNYHNPEVLLEMVDVLLFYVERGAAFLRLDAVAYIWKEPGTTCIHLPQAHALIKLLRAVLDAIAPHVSLITETNVPHEENLSYFGNGKDEAQLVYNFSLPPLVLHAIQTGSAQALSTWAQSLALPSREVTFFNFLASHDGIGLNPLHGILPQGEIDRLVERVKMHAGMVSFKQAQDGGLRPYELNINYFDALNPPAAAEPLGLQIDRFIAAHAVLLAMPGVPALYFHSLLGLRGWPAGVKETGRSRTINRQKFQRQELEARLADRSSTEARVLERLGKLLQVRAAQESFHPFGKWQVLQAGAAVFGLLRRSPDGGGAVLCLHNLSTKQCSLPEGLFEMLSGGRPRDLVNERQVSIEAGYRMQPYEVLWLEADR